MKKGSTVIRYINNTASDITAGMYVVPKFDQLILNDFVPALDALAGRSLLVLVDGVELTSDLIPVNIAHEASKSVPKEEIKK